jgi:hypothetical protein
VEEEKMETPASPGKVRLIHFDCEKLANSKHTAEEERNEMKNSSAFGFGVKIC